METLEISKNQSFKQKIKQLFCKHKNIGYYRMQTKYHNIQGENVYRICEDCNKIIDREFLSNEDFMYRFR